MTTPTQSDTALIAQLNDLLQLDHDALHAYTLAIESIRDEQHRERLRAFRGDHERHVSELTQLIRAHGGMPIQLPHVPTGAFKLAVQAAGKTGGDRGVLLAFKTNERQVRDKYRAAASRAHPADVVAVLERAATDEERHYAWVLETLEELGAGADSAIGKAANAFEVGHKNMANAIEGAERVAMRGAEGARRGLKRATSERGVATALLAVGAGFIAARLLGGGRR